MLGFITGIGVRVRMINRVRVTMRIAVRLSSTVFESGLTLDSLIHVESDSRLPHTSQD